MKGIKKLPLAVAIAALSSGAMALQPIADEELDGMTGQSGITITTTMQADIDKASYQDSGNSVTAEGIKLRGNGGGSLSQTVTIDVFENSQLATEKAGLENRAAGDAIKIGVTSLNADIDIAAVRMGTADASGHAGGNSIGRIEIDGLSAAGTDTYVYALDGSDGIGIDTVVNQSIGRVVYQDIGFDGTNAVADDNGTIQLHGITMSSIDMTGTEIHILDGTDSEAINSNDTIKISQPAITNGSMSVAAIQIGASDISTAAGQDEVIGSADIKGLTTVASPLYIYTEDGNEGLRIRQTTNVSASEVSYISGGLSGYGATAADRDDDGKGSITLAGLNFQSAESDVKIDVTAGGVSIDSPLTNASFTVRDVQLGGNSMGGFAVSGLNITQNAVTITAH